jgi:polyisoprenyl-phosphate glycosyltransferase
VSVELSVVLPVFNEEANLDELHRRLVTVLEGAVGSFELLYVDDGSRDGSWPIIERLAASDRRVRGLRFSRNFGHQMAFAAGVDHAGGDAVVIMDADLQDPPELIPDLLARHREGYEVVYAVRASRPGETVFKRASARLFYRVLRALTRVEVPVDTGDFRLMGRRSVEAFRGLREQRRYTRGLVAWLGFRQTGVPFVRPARRAGQSNYPLRSMVRLAVDGITAFSLAPLQLATWLGLFVTAIAALVAIALGVMHVAGMSVTLRSALVVALFFLGGIQLLALGLLGTYVGRIYDEVRGRSLYIVEETVGGKTGQA